MIVILAIGFAIPLKPLQAVILEEAGSSTLHTLKYRNSGQLSNGQGINNKLQEQTSIVLLFQFLSIYLIVF